jgi:hypothetical protein
MSSARILLARVQRLEQARRAPRSPFEVGWGSVDAWATEVEAGFDTGTLDRIDKPVVIAWSGDGMPTASGSACGGCQCGILRDENTAVRVVHSGARTGPPAPRTSGRSLVNRTSATVGAILR